MSTLTYDTDKIADALLQKLTSIEDAARERTVWVRRVYVIWFIRGFIGIAIAFGLASMVFNLVMRTQAVPSTPAHPSLPWQAEALRIALGVASLAFGVVLLWVCSLAKAYCEARADGRLTLR